MKSQFAKGKALEWIPELKMSPNGVFKYILVKVSINGKPNSLIVRGDTKYAYHSENFCALKDELKGLGFNQVEGDEDQIKALKDELLIELTCLGGGRIEHQHDDNLCSIYGYSQRYGPIGHEIAQEIIARQ